MAATCRKGLPKTALMDPPKRLPGALQPCRRRNTEEKGEVSDEVAQVLLPKPSAVTATKPNTDIGVASARRKSWT